MQRSLEATWHTNLFWTARTYQPGEMRLPTSPRPAFYQEMSSEAASSSSQLKTVGPQKRQTRVDKEEVQTNETMEDLTETRDELEQLRKSLVRTRKDRYVVKAVRGLQQEARRRGKGLGKE